MKTQIKIVFLIAVLKRCCAQTEEGDACSLQSEGIPGRCTLIDNCKYAKELLKKGQIPQTCGFSGNRPVVCCKKKPPGEISREKCVLYRGFHVYAIFTGTSVKPRVYRHMAALGYGNPEDIQWQCGGSLISERFILTAAHCVKSKELGTVKIVRLGELDLKNTTEDASPLDVGVLKIFVHPGYHPPSHYNDIALLELKQNISSGPFIKPACLKPDNNIESNKKYIITGWGKTDFAGDASAHLLEARINIIPHEKCSKRYSTVSQRRLPSGILDKSQICAGDPVGSDTCPGDSGGPLQEVVERSSKWPEHHVVLGITSFGRGCGFKDSAGVYTRVSEYLEWIENIVWPEG